MFRFETVLSGANMGSGLSVMHAATDAGASDIDDALAAIRQFWFACASAMPNTVTINVSNVVQTRDEATGDLTGQQTGAVQTGVTGTATGAFAAGVGARVRWPTEGIRNGRQVIGTTFIVPLGATMYEANGSLSSACVTTLQGAASALVTSMASAFCNLSVWSRPTTPGGSDGLLSAATSTLVPDQVSWLRTRRS